MTFRPKFDEVIPEHRLAERKHYRWSAIRQAKGEKAPAIPRAWINPLVVPYLKPTRLNQDQRGTCTGYATVMGQYLLDVLLLMKNYPKPADFEAIRRDVQVRKEGWTCTMFWDSLVPQMPSMQFAYEKGREEEWPDPDERPPEGGMVDACVRMWKKIGWVQETWCRTAKTPACVPQYENELGITEEQILQEAGKHILEGYAICDTFDEICEAIYTSYQEGKGGFAVIGVNILEDYANLMLKTVEGKQVWIYPGKSGESVGGHAQCIIGYDLDQGILVVASSWADNDKEWPFLNGWDRRYHLRCASAAYVPIDTKDVAVGQKLYSTVVIQANVPCHFTVKRSDEPEQTFLEQPVRISLEDYVMYRITAYPLEPLTVEEDQIGSPIIPNKADEVTGPDGKPAIYVYLKFTKKPEPSLWQRILTALRELLRRLLK